MFQPDMPLEKSSKNRIRGSGSYLLRRVSALSMARCKSCIGCFLLLAFRPLKITRSSLHRARCEPGDDVALEERDEEDHGKDLQGDGGEQHAPADAVYRAEHLADHQRPRAGLGRREDE